MSGLEWTVFSLEQSHICLVDYNASKKPKSLYHSSMSPES